jgi:UDP-glucose 4-epimerase
LESFYRGRAVLVTGGLGFIGSNLVIRLAGLGAKVTVVDSCVPGCGSNPENICPTGSRIKLIERDIGDAAAFRSAVSESEIIFNLAGEVSHIHSMRQPTRDLRINALAQLQFLTECAASAPGVRIVYASTRQVYGMPRYLPVDERHPIEPVDFNGIHKHAAGQYHIMLSRAGRLDAAVLRLTNVYGPRMAVHAPCQGFLPVFFRRLLRNEPIEIYGDGAQVRDPVYVSDVVESFLIVGRIQKLPSRVYNIGGPAALPIHQIARVTCEAAGAAVPVRRAFPETLRQIDIGGYSTDWRLAQRELNWSPRVSLEQGLASTIAYFRANWAKYQEAARSMECPLPAAEETPRLAIA